MQVTCKCGENLGDVAGPNGSVKARSVTISNGELRVKCPKCHHHQPVPGVTVVASSRPGPAVAVVRKSEPKPEP